MTDAPCIWAEGSARLLDYGAENAGMASRTVLFVPSLVNRFYVLDLMENRSFLRFLAQQGLRPLVLDWGWPAEAERQFDLTTYVAGRLERALMAAAKAGPVILAGYCMGGLLALGAVQRRPDLVRALALLATPWDFHAGQPPGFARIGLMLPALEPIIAAHGGLPVDMLQAMFASLEPERIRRKYRSFGRLAQDSERARHFVALEDWLNDGVPMAAPVARECLGGWYGMNTPVRGEWCIAGQAVQPQTIDLPCFVVTPTRDKIVPPAGAICLANLIKGAVLHEPGAGHVGMVAGSQAEQVLWRPMLAWMNDLDRV